MSVHVMDLSRETAERKFNMLKGQVDKADGYVFATFDSTIDMSKHGIKGFKEPLKDVITRIWYDGKLIYHGSQYLVVEGKMSPKGASVFFTSESEHLIEHIGEWPAIELWLGNSSEMAMFLGNSYGDILRGCKAVESLLCRGVWVNFFKTYNEQFATAVAYVKAGRRS